MFYNVFINPSHISLTYYFMHVLIKQFHIKCVGGRRMSARNREIADLAPKDSPSPPSLSHIFSGRCNLFNFALTVKIIFFFLLLKMTFE